MSLVAYASSDESEDSDNEEVSSSNDNKNVANETKCAEKTIQKNIERTKLTNKSIPQSSKIGGIEKSNDNENVTSSGMHDDDMIISSHFVSKNEFEDELEPSVKNVEASGSGHEGKSLLSNLPPPKKSKSNTDLLAKTDQVLGKTVAKKSSDEQNTHILAGLPQPKHRSSDDLIEEEDELEDIVKHRPVGAEIPKPPPKPIRHKQPVRIEIPALPDPDEGEPSSKKPKVSSGARSKLSSLLPPPKNAVTKKVNRSLVPHTLTKKPNKPATVKAAPAVSSTNRLISSTVSKPSPATVFKLAGVPDIDSDEDDDKDAPISFFSLDSTSKQPGIVNEKMVTLSPSLPPVTISHSNTKTEVTGKNSDSEESDIEMDSSEVTLDTTEKTDEEVGAPLFGNPNPELADAPLNFKANAMPQQQTWGWQGTADRGGTSHQPSYSQMYSEQIFSDSSEQITKQGESVDEFMQDEQFLRLQGKKGRREEINIININADDQTHDVDLAKNISEEQDVQLHSRKKKNMPSSQQRKKHQITYLAFQAKEQELELKNQWAQNRQTKRHAQSKYGF